MAFSVALFTSTTTSIAKADGLVENWLSSVAADQEIRIVAKQVEDFSNYNGSFNQAVEYEPTGERFMNREEIESALVNKKQRLNDLVKLINSSSV